MIRRMWECALLSTLVATAALAEPDSWVQLGPEGGRFSAIAVDPDAPDTQYAVGQYRAFRRVGAGAAWEPLLLGYGVFSVAVAGRGTVYFGSFGRVFRSTDGAEHFVSSDVPGNGVITVLTVDPRDPEHVYAISEVIGVEPGTSSNTLLVTTSGLEWSEISTLPLSATSLTVDPDDPQRLYLGTTREGVLVSTDAGATWTPSGDDPPCPGVDNSGEPRACVESILALDDAVVIGTQDDGVLRSTDGGETWQAVSEPAYVESFSTAGNALFAAGATAWPGLGRSADVRGLVMRSDDAGATWEPADATLPAPIAMVAPDPREPDRLYAATGSRWGFQGHGLYASRDGGGSWQLDQAGLIASCASSLLATATSMTTLHAALPTDIAPLAITRDGGTTWVEPEIDPRPRFLALAVDPNDPRHLAAAAFFDGLFVSRDGGDSWEQHALNGEPALEVAFDAVDPDTLYIVGPQNGLAKSTDGGLTFEIVLRDDEFGITNVAVDEASGAVFATSYSALQGSYDGGATWTQLGDPSDDGFGQLAIAPTSPAGLYVLTNGGLRISEDGGRDWRSPKFPAAAYDNFATHIVIDPSRAVTAYAVGYTGAGSQAYRSDDAGHHWRAVGDAVPDGLLTLAVDPHDRRLLYSGTCSGVQLLAQGSSSSGGAGNDGCAVVPPDVSATLLAAHGLAIGLLGLLRARR
jgi:photosystem II stability/assembly factor-like uncharacterized protein